MVETTQAQEMSGRQIMMMMDSSWSMPEGRHKSSKGGMWRQFPPLEINTFNGGRLMPLMLRLSWNENEDDYLSIWRYRYSKCTSSLNPSSRTAHVPKRHTYTHTRGIPRCEM